MTILPLLRRIRLQELKYKRSLVKEVCELRQAPFIPALYKLSVQELKQILKEVRREER